MPRPKNTEARRAQIVDAFLTLMAERGYDGTSIAAMAQVAGLNQGLVHYHFAGKEAVLLEAVRTLTQIHAAQVEAALEAAADPLARIHAFVEVHLGLGAHADPRALACWVAIGAEAARRPAVQALYRGALTALGDLLTETLARAHAEGLVAHEDPAAAAAALLAIVQGYFEIAAAAPGFIPRGSAANSTLAMLNGLLRPARPLEQA